MEVQTDFPTFSSEPIPNNTFAVSYPFSEFANKTSAPIDWDTEFMLEWEAHEQGSELPRRFIWEDRGRYV